MVMVKNKHRFKPGTVSLREIRKLQKMGNTLIFARNPFEKYVREIFCDYNKDLKISKNVFTILQYALEFNLVKLLTDSNNAAIHAGRVKMMPTDIDFIRKITKISSICNQTVFEYEMNNSESEDEESEDKGDEGDEGDNEGDDSEQGEEGEDSEG